MIDQLIIGNIASHDAYEASVKERKINAPKKKSIKGTVPYSNRTYDFSAINGEVYWEERTLEYVFEIMADTPEELEEKKQKFMAWIMVVQEENLHDPFIHDYHFIATFDDMVVDDSEVEKSTIGVTFTAYPYMVSNAPKSVTAAITNVDKAVFVQNDSCHKIVPTVTCDVPFAVTIGESVFHYAAGSYNGDEFTLAVGTSDFLVKAESGSGTFKIEFYEEVF